jgi:hypothetical protein
MIELKELLPNMRTLDKVYWGIQAAACEGEDKANEAVDVIGTWINGPMKIEYNLEAADEKKEPEKVRCSVPFWIAGGAVLASIAGTKINDYDVFSPEPHRLVEFLKQAGWWAGYEDERVVNMYSKEIDAKVQVVKRFAPINPDAIFKTFDFTIVCGAWDGETLFAHDRFFVDIAQKRLVIVELFHPLSTMSRALKYTTRGYMLCPVGQMTLAKAIQTLEIDWSNPDQNILEFYPDGTPRFAGVD